MNKIIALLKDVARGVCLGLRQNILNGGEIYSIDTAKIL